MHKKIIQSIATFNLNLSGKKVLTEAASGNYVVTSLIAALSGANVVAITKDSKYASIDEVIKQTKTLAKSFDIQDQITIVVDENQIDYSHFDIVTNTGFVRPIDKNKIKKMSPYCVIPLMWEPWEYRKADLDLNACREKGIKVYGTNESDLRLQTMHYIGFIVLYFLLEQKKSPFSSKVLILGNSRFTIPITDILERNGYHFKCINDYQVPVDDLEVFDVIIVAEHEQKNLIIGPNGFISNLETSVLIIHICGNVNFDSLDNPTIPEKPADVGFMSFTTDFIDNKAVIDLHTAGLKVAEGMLEANALNLSGINYKTFMESNYPALAFDDGNLW